MAVELEHNELRELSSLPVSSWRADQKETAVSCCKLVEDNVPKEKFEVSMPQDAVWWRSSCAC